MVVPPDLRGGGARHASHESLPPSKPYRPQNLREWLRRARVAPISVLDRPPRGSRTSRQKRYNLRHTSQLMSVADQLRLIQTTIAELEKSARDQHDQLQSALALAQQDREQLERALEHACRERDDQKRTVTHLREEREQAVLARDEALAQGREEGRAQGVAQGRADGMEQGRAQGVAQGRAEAIEQGRAEGIEQGRVQGIEQGRAEGIEH